MAAAEGRAVLRIRGDVEALAERPRHREANRDGLVAARRYVEASLTDSGWAVSHQEFRRANVIGVSDRKSGSPLLRLRVHRDLQGTNLLAIRSDAQPPYLVIGAHLDTVMHSPGADDNASGVAVILELARRLAHSTRVSTMLAVLDMEEVGFVGSRYLARQMARQKTASAMICLETIGAYSEMAHSQKVPVGMRHLLKGAHAAETIQHRRGDFLGVIHRRSSRTLADSIIAASAVYELPTLRISDPRPDGVPGLLATALLPPLATLDRSDHLPFWRRRIPAVMLTDTANLRNANYHKPTDTADTLDYERLAALSDALLDVVSVGGTA